MEERYTELFQNVYGAKNEHPLNKIEEKREEIKDIVKRSSWNAEPSKRHDFWNR